jgi:hypothetical protein
MSNTFRIFFACLIDILRSRKRISYSAPSVCPSVPFALRRLYSGRNFFASCDSESDPSAEYIFLEKRTTSSVAVQLARHSSSIMMTRHSSFILVDKPTHPFILQAGYFIMTISFAISLILAYVVVIALVVTACGMHFYEPGVIVVVARTVASDDEGDCISIVYAD